MLRRLPVTNLAYTNTIIPFHTPTTTSKMSAEGETAPKVAIGIAFGNSYSSIAYTSGEFAAEVIANEEGGQIP